MLLRTKSLGGGGNVPDANGVAAQVLLDLAALTGKAEYRAAAQRTLRSLAGLMERNPFASEHLLLAAADFLRQPPAPAPRPAPAGRAAAENGPEPANPDVSRRAAAVTIRAYASRLSVRPGGSLQVAVTLDIDEGWHLYGENPEAELLVATAVKAEPAAHLGVGDIARPEPHRAFDPLLDKTLDTYTGRIRFQVPVTVPANAPAGAVTLALAVHTQACDANRCLQPETTALRIPLVIDPVAPAEPRHWEVFPGAGR